MRKNIIYRATLTVDGKPMSFYKLTDGMKARISGILATTSEEITLEVVFNEETHTVSTVYGEEFEVIPTDAVCLENAIPMKVIGIESSFFDFYSTNKEDLFKLISSADTAIPIRVRGIIGHHYRVGGGEVTTSPVKSLIQCDGKNYILTQNTAYEVI